MVIPSVHAPQVLEPATARDGVTAVAARSPGADPLVTTSISQQETIEIYRNQLKIRRPHPSNPKQIIFDRSGTTLQGFSSKSKSRLRHAATNATPELISQFGLTYHSGWPTDGRVCKSQLNHFLTFLRKTLPGVKYLWLMEFQSRNAPHFHIFLTCLPESTVWNQLADKWSEITNGTQEQTWFHGSARGKNWIPWSMGDANYLCKYIDKESQKTVPAGYFNFGRFWGNSRGLVPDPETHPIKHLDTISHVDQETGEIYGGETTIIRWLGRLAEKQTRGYSRFRTRAQFGSYSMQRGSPAYRQIENYFRRLNQ